LHGGARVIGHTQTLQFRIRVDREIRVGRGSSRA
jgi:hypothetical protein